MAQLQLAPEAPEAPEEVVMEEPMEEEIVMEEVMMEAPMEEEVVMEEIVMEAPMEEEVDDGRCIRLRRNGDGSGDDGRGRSGNG